MALPFTAWQSRLFISATLVLCPASSFAGNGELAGCGQPASEAHKAADAHYQHGLAAGMRSDSARALAEFDRAIELDPQYADAYSGRGMEKHAKGDMDGAIADFDHAIALAPLDADHYSHRGDAKVRKEDFEGAIADYTRVIELSGNPYSGYLLRGDAKRSKGDFDGAIADYTEALKLVPQNSFPYILRGKAYFFKGEPVQAASDFARVVELNAHSPDPNAAADAALWLYLARSSAKVDGRNELAANTQKLDNRYWPAPVVALYLGLAAPETLHYTDPKADHWLVCEASFYLAEWYMLKNDNSRALPHLRTAKERCADYFTASSDAAVQLRMLEIAK